MTDPNPTKKRTVDRTGPLDEFTIAARICRILETWPAEAVDVEKEVREAVAERHRKRQADINALYARATTEERRIAANNIVAARRLPLCGFELYANGANDTPRASDGEGADSRLGPPGPVTPTPRVEIDRDERKTGAQRK